MDRRKSLKILGAGGLGIAGLVFADWKWQLVDQLTHQGFFNFQQEKLITAVADTIIPAGIPSIAPENAQPIGALSTGTDKFLIRLFEHCYEKEDQKIIKRGLDKLGTMDFLAKDQKAREDILINMQDSENEADQRFFQLMKSQTIYGFTTVREVMVEYHGYKVAAGGFKGCVPASEVLI
ncbi:gluconate 2-dehydrogenase subunit 3 family protein [Algoriphagus sp. NF]|uniref:gluconate 2-dehydrogenase subunit 3 family protein n=1 Tax=Algoriphagus sp. NF TaxID=2992756 RepID=UPI00237A7078|nr:gluconate 2-dehydrogenase subunit 3 family protein [Algoriphagus sp. NF]MDE0561465.1 gluconate 2-dehydrogenase subunit 3 family protein [Algoriphagus sp. NF]